MTLDNPERGEMIMTRTTWNPLGELETLRRELERELANDEGAGRGFPFSRFSFLPGRSARTYPLINLGEDDHNLYVEALAPGVDPKTLAVSIQGDQLTLSGEKTTGVGQEVKPDAYHRNERAAGRFTRTITIPAEVQPDRVEARYENGLINLTLPKHEAARPRRINVNVG